MIRLAPGRTDFTLRRYLEDQAAGTQPYHFTTIDRRLKRSATD